MHTRSLIALALVLAGSVTIAAQPERSHHDQAAVSPSTAQAQPAKPVNDRCPIQGEEVDPETPALTWRGHLIGFCCPGCDTKWDAKPDSEKDAFLAKYVKVDPASAPLQLAKQFQTAMTTGDLTAMNKLFLADSKATVLENGADEGSWETYRDGHLRSELKDLVGYAWNTKVETETRHGPTSIIRQVGTFSIGPEGARRTFSAAITFVVVDDGGTPRIAHMHWSSRESKALAE